MHLHGSYSRRKHPTGSEIISIPRYRDPPVGRTASVLPDGCLPYRPVQAERLQTHFDHCSGAHQGLDPPANVVEAGCLRRAWLVLGSRQKLLRSAFGQLVDACLSSVEELWCQIRRARSTIPEILTFLFETHQISLFGDYVCSRDWRK